MTPSSPPSLGGGRWGDEAHPAAVKAAVRQSEILSKDEGPSKEEGLSKDEDISLNGDLLIDLKRAR